LKSKVILHSFSYRRKWEYFDFLLYFGAGIVHKNMYFAVYRYTAAVRRKMDNFRPGNQYINLANDTGCE